MVGRPSGLLEPQWQRRDAGYLKAVWVEIFGLVFQKFPAQFSGVFAGAPGPRGPSFADLTLHRSAYKLARRTQSKACKEDSATSGL